MNKKSRTKTPSHYVGVGASAGGLEAIEAFFSKMPTKTDLAFIVVQHLSPDYKSLMVELLSKRTQIPVKRAEDGIVVEKNTIYLIPPKKNLTIFHGKLLLSEQDHTRGINLPIDLFFRSLADDQAERSVAVILSGTGSDGMRGIKAIKEAGGMIMVQAEETAKFDGMPRSAISTGLADFILPPEDMAEHLLSFVKHPYVSKSERTKTIISDEDGLDRIFSLLRARTKLDFTYYKPSTVIRRIERRISINQLDGLKEYVEFLEKNSNEVIALYRELLIGVTNFFRDKDAFNELGGKWLYELLEKKANQDIRFWVAGCSGGEEAYSIAILTREYLDLIGSKSTVKIFATDVDRDAIMAASNGIYPESITAEMKPEYIAKYFMHRNNMYEVTREIREMVVFAQHNLIKDPPFNNIDLVTCRNLLIYLQPVLQKKVLEMFNFSLNHGGILFLGSSETTGELSEYFEPLSTKWKIYRSKGKRKQLDDTFDIPLPDNPLRKTGATLHTTHYSTRQREDRLLQRILDSLTSDYVPLMVVVNDQMEAQYVLGDTNGYFRVPSGKMQNDISKMAVKELSIPLTTGIQKAFNSKREITYSNIKLLINGEKKIIDLKLKGLPEKRGQQDLVAVFIKEVSSIKTTESASDKFVFDVGKEAEQRIHDLESELQFTKENLQATIEELETSNEELQATNEELLSSNEELQSTNEELQSVNEELHTVNAEHQNKIIELTELNNDIENLLASTDIGTLFLDENLEIRKFTPKVSDVFKILEQDIGRPVNHLTHGFLDVDPIKIIETVHELHEPREVEAEYENGRWYLLRILPYKIGKKAYSGVIVTIIEISTIKNTREKLSESEEKYKRLFETMNQGVVYQDKYGHITSANPAALDILGLTLDQMLGRTSKDPSWRTIREDGSDFPGEEHPSMIALKTGKKVENRIMGVYHPEEQSHRWINVNAVPLFSPQSKEPYSVYTTFDDITDQFITNKLLSLSNERLTSAMHVGKLAWWEMEYPSGKVSFSDEKVLLLGYDPVDFKDADYKQFMELVHPDDADKAMQSMRDLLDNKDSIYNVTYRIKANDGSYHWFEDIGSITKIDDNGNPVTVTGIVVDVTDRQKQSEELEEIEVHYRYLFTEMLNGAAYHKIVLDDAGNPIDYIFLDVNKSFEKLTGLKHKDVVGKRVTEVIPDIKESATDWIGMYGKVALSGKPIRFESHFENLDKTFQITAYCPKKQYFVAVFDDVSSVS